VALEQENTKEHISILTDISFCINTIRNYTINPAAFNQHLHKDLIQLTNQLLKYRESKPLKIHIGKVKSHTDVEYNETTDTSARAVVNGETTPNTTLEDTDPPIRELRTWPQIRHTPPNKPEIIRKLTNLKACIKQKLKHTDKTVTKGIFGRLFQEARDTRTDFSIQAYSQSPYRSRCDAYEVAWGSHV
jgi:hypothetical protein